MASRATCSGNTVKPAGGIFSSRSRGEYTHRVSIAFCQRTGRRFSQEHCEPVATALDRDLSHCHSARLHDVENQLGGAAHFADLPAAGGPGRLRVARLVKGVGRRWMPAAGMLLIVWVAADSGVSHPDYIAYFNPLASAHPEKVLSESDLDRGQDLFRLAARLRSWGVARFTMKYFGTTPLEVAGLPPHLELSPTVRASGYVAVSIRYVALEHAKDGSYDWLKRYQPLEKVGQSIFLYFIP